jgi:hypothetical protein
MPYNFPDLHAEKKSVVRELFISTADDNYTLARWCFQQKLNVDFFWLAVHCLEKYFKAALLMNGHSSQGYNHRIVDLYEAVRPLALWPLSQARDRGEEAYRGDYRNRPRT